MMYDAIEIDDDAKLEITSDGYLKAMPRIARTGIQHKGDDADGQIDVVRVYRRPAYSRIAPRIVTRTCRLLLSIRICRR